MSLATLVVSPECFEEIACRLAAAGHKQIFLKTVTGVMIDMKGIALVAEELEEGYGQEELTTKEKNDYFEKENK